MIRDILLSANGRSTIGTNWTLQPNMGTEWLTQEAPQNPGILMTYPGSIAWSGTQFCAVGVFGTCATSPDGVTWTVQHGLKAIGFESIALPVIRWGGGKFCVIGSGRLCATSPDGVTWALGNGPSDVDFFPFDMVWAGTEFYAVGSDMWVSWGPGSGVILKSTDGSNWTTYRLQDGGPSSIVWTGDTLCVVAGDAINYDPSGGIPTCYLSHNGVTWQPYSAPIDVYYRPSMAWNGTQFCLTGSGSAYQSDLSCSMYTSPDAHTWTLQEGFARAPYGFSRGNVASIAGQFIAYGARVLTSADGITWVPQPTFSQGRIEDLAWSGTTLCGVGCATPGYTQPIAVTST